MLLTGARGCSRAGYDIGDMPEDTFAEEAEKLVAHPFADAIEALEAYPFPIVAALNGHAIGGGLELALACDLRVAAAGPGWGCRRPSSGWSTRTRASQVPRHVGAARTRELFLTGAQRDAETALDGAWSTPWSRADALEAAALDLAVEIAANAPLSQRGNKRVMRELLAATPR